MLFQFYWFPIETFTHTAAAHTLYSLTNWCIWPNIFGTEAGQLDSFRWYELDSCVFVSRSLSIQYNTIRWCIERSRRTYTQHIFYLSMCQPVSRMHLLYYICISINYMNTNHMSGERVSVSASASTRLIHPNSHTKVA